MDKQEKDLLQAEALLMVLEDSMPHLIKAAWDDLKWQDKAVVGIATFKDKTLKDRLLLILG